MVSRLLGYSDVAVGAHTYDSPEVDEGRVFVYLGSASGLASTASWTAESNQAGAQFGVPVSSAGDVNGDGYGDLIVGAQSYDNPEANEGQVFLYLGSSTGLAASPYWTAEGNQVEAAFGNAVSTAGDVNGDGYSDVIIGAKIFDNGQAEEGKAFVYLGSATGLAASPSWTAEGNQSGAYFGFAVATAGDVNGDGFADVLVGAPLYDGSFTDEGASYAFFGSASGPSTTASWSVVGGQAFANLGVSGNTAGDVNGDGFSDLLVGAEFTTNGQTREGRASLYLGSGLAPQTSPSWSATTADAPPYGQYRPMALAGDVNGDGFSDVLVGGPFDESGEPDEGIVYLFNGSASGPAGSPSWTFQSNEGGANLGISVAGAGDVNGDGYADVIIGAPHRNSSTGRVYVFHGSVLGLQAAPARVLDGDQFNRQFGNVDRLPRDSQHYPDRPGAMLGRDGYACGVGAVDSLRYHATRPRRPRCGFLGGVLSYRRLLVLRPRCFDGLGNDKERIAHGKIRAADRGE